MDGHSVVPALTSVGMGGWNALVPVAIEDLPEHGWFDTYLCTRSTITELDGSFTHRWFQRTPIRLNMDHVQSLKAERPEERFRVMASSGGDCRSWWQRLVDWLP